MTESLQIVNICYDLFMPEGQEVPSVPKPAEKSSRFRAAWEAIKNFRKGKESPVSSPNIPTPVQNLPEAVNQSSTVLATEEPTVEETEQTSDTLEATVEGNPELNAFTKAELALFFEFSDKHQQLIQQQLATGKSPTDIIYENFCLVNLDSPDYTESTPSMGLLEREYVTFTRLADKNLRRLKNSGEVENIDPEIGSFEYVDWNVNGGVQSKGATSDNLGRLYLDIDITRLPDLYQDLVKSLAQADNPLHAELKIYSPGIYSRLGHLSELNRFDKLVLYFESAEQEAVYNIVQDLYKSSKASFLEGTPRFSAPLVDSNGEVMRGVSFGQEPTYAVSEDQTRSFSHVRAGILAEVLEEAERDPTIQTDEDKLAQIFFAACKRNDVDPNNPAFNLGSDKFQFIRLKAAQVK